MYQEAQTMVAPRRQVRIGDFAVRLFKEKPLGVAGGLIVSVAVVVAIMADVIAPYGYNEIHLADRLQPPWIHRRQRRNNGNFPGGCVRRRRLYLRTGYRS